MPEITPMHVGAVIGAILILLGFFALLAQKIYIDPRTNAPSEIEMPILGKMKANYPALVFVFLGCGMVALGLSRYERVRHVAWMIDGSITSDAAQINWQEGRLKIWPTNIEQNIDPETGQFHIRLDIEEDKTFEEVIEFIDYSHPMGRVYIDTQVALDLKRHEGKSKLIAETPRSRRYKVQLESMPRNDD